MCTHVATLSAILCAGHCKMAAPTPTPANTIPLRKAKANACIVVYSHMRNHVWFATISKVLCVVWTRRARRVEIQMTMKLCRVAVPVASIVCLSCYKLPKEIQFISDIRLICYVGDIGIILSGPTKKIYILYVNAFKNTFLLSYMKR